MEIGRDRKCSIWYENYQWKRKICCGIQFVKLRLHQFHKYTNISES